MNIAELIRAIVGTTDIPVRFTNYDGTTFGPDDASTTFRILSPDAIHRILTARGQELGFSRAIIAGDIEIEGDIFGVFDVNRLVQAPGLDRSIVRHALDLIGVDSLRDLAKLKPLPPPPEEIELTGRLHSRQRDAEAISRHYDVSNDFYRIVLGPSMTYSCAIFNSPECTLYDAQFEKQDIICRKLGLETGMRHLDIGCGWGSLAIHAAKHYGTTSIGVTISHEQAELARKRVAEAGLTDQVEIRVQDYRDIPEDNFDAISSIGMAEHVGGSAQLRRYFDNVQSLLAPNGRYLNHAIAKAPDTNIHGRNGFVQRYVFPDGELHEIGATITSLQEAGFEVRHMESFRLHYARTLRAWVKNLEDRWDDAVAEVGRGRAMIWRIYMAGSAVAFERGEIEIHQTLAIRHGADSESIPFRQRF